MSNWSVHELVLPRRVVYQRTQLPPIAPGGDCGACVLSGLTGLSLRQVYERCLPEDREPQGFTWQGMKDAIHKLSAYEIIDRCILDVPTWKCSDYWMSFGQPAWLVGAEWFNYIHMAIEAGYYPVCGVDMDKKGPLTCLNHWVMIVGIRVRTEKKPTHNSVETEILVNCSSIKTPDESWVHVNQFLKESGGYNCFLVKPKP